VPVQTQEEARDMSQTGTNDVTGTAAGPERTHSGPTYVPPTDIYETETEIFVVADMPGVKPEGVTVELEGRTLTITGAPAEHGTVGGEPVRLEYRPGGYGRAFTVSDAIDRERIRASMKDGVLTLVLPKAAPARTQKVHVQAG
jgi:HSP20 family protein